MTKQIAPNTAELIDILSFRRLSRSKTEESFISRFIAPLGAQPDSFGNYVLRIGTAPVLYSSHTDSVHRAGGRQAVRVRDGIATLAKESKSNCLGADNGVGVWIMREMIKANRPGLYIFHRDEETGGHGSAHIAKHSPELLQGIDAAIAFDRRGTGSIITHQSGLRTASDSFAHSLAAQIGHWYMPDTGGSFTDTANYADIIPECSNVSAGFADEHSTRESLDLDHAETLCAAMIAIQPAALSVARDPASVESLWDDYPDNAIAEGGYGMESLIVNNPDAIADLLTSMGFDSTELADEIYSRQGYVARR